MTVLEAATYVKLSKSSLDHMRSAGRGPRFTKIGTRVIYDTRDLDTWLDGHKHTSTADHAQMPPRRRRRRQRGGEPKWPKS
jgi:hypothetical protein